MNKSPIPPDENRIEELLEKIQPVPSAAFHQKMKQAAWRVQEEWVVKKFRLKVAFAVITLAALSTFFVTPQGRAWAQELFQFFTRIESSTVELPESMHGMEPPDPYNVPLIPALIPTVSPEMQAIPGCETAQDAQSYNCQVSLAESQLGFDLKELPSQPGRNFQFLLVSRASKSAMFSYIFDSRYRNSATLYLSQGIGDISQWNASNPWDVVPADKVEIVKVGNHPGEFVEGSFSTPAGSSTMEWSTQDRKRLAWSDGTRWYFIDLWRNPNTADRIRRDEMIALAESLVDSLPEINQELDPEYLYSVLDAEQLSGLDLKAPTLLPMDVDFSYARFHDGQVRLVYGVNEELVIHQWKGDSLDFDALSTSSYSNYRIVEVHGKKAFYGSVEGADPHLFLWWQAAGLNHQMYYYEFFGLIDRNKMIAIAESMQDINDFRLKTNKPYEYVSIYEQALEMDAKEFPEIPTGWSFANLWGDPSNPCMALVYTSLTKPGWMYIDQCRTDERFRLSDIPSRVLERVKIGDVTGQYAMGESVTNADGKLTWNSDAPMKQLFWKQDGLWMHMVLSGESALLYDKTDLIAYAESLR